jgi:hypothetical protein
MQKLQRDLLESKCPSFPVPLLLKQFLLLVSYVSFQRLCMHKEANAYICIHKNIHTYMHILFYTNASYMHLWIYSPIWLCTFLFHLTIYLRHFSPILTGLLSNINSLGLWTRSDLSFSHHPFHMYPVKYPYVI